MRRRLGRMPARLLVFLPSLVLGFCGAVWMALSPLQLGPPAHPLLQLSGGALLAASLLAGGWLLERLLPSYRHAARLLERRLAALRPSLPLVVALAGATAVGEELFFRGGLMQLLGPWGQALAFGLMHPAPRRGWAYTAYAGLAGLALGFAVIVTGSLLTAMVAHFIINLHGLLSLPRRRAPAVPRMPAGGGPPEGGGDARG